MPGHADQTKLLDVVKNTRPDNPDTILALAVELSRQKSFAAAAQVTRNAEKLVGSRKELLAHYQARLNVAMPGWGGLLS